MKTKLLFISLLFSFLIGGLEQAQAQNIDGDAVLNINDFDNPNGGVQEMHSDMGKTHFIDAASHVFIDQSLEDPEILKQAVRKDNKGLHLFTHGKPGQLLIDGQWLQKEEIVRFLNSKFKIQNFLVFTAVVLRKARKA